MGGWSARKCLKVIDNVQNILAIELLAACQALEFFHSKGLTSTEPLEAVHSMVRKSIQPWAKDRYMSPDIKEAAILIENKKIWNVAKKFLIDYNKHCGKESTNLSCLLENCD
jgi:histidine ammonia-lyase